MIDKVYLQAHEKELEAGISWVFALREMSLLDCQHHEDGFSLDH